MINQIFSYRDPISHIQYMLSHMHVHVDPIVGRVDNMGGEESIEYTIQRVGVINC